jgi:hypothetical protein
MGVISTAIFLAFGVLPAHASATVDAADLHHRRLHALFAPGTGGSPLDIPRRMACNSNESGERGADKGEGGAMDFMQPLR